MRGLSRFAVALAALVLPSVACAQATQPAAAPPSAAKPADRVPVLVELFTSEGCPHCPEADSLLERLFTSQSVKGAEIVALEEHVDYWDRPTWTDHFASPVYTERQKAYADAMDLDSLYTPQMVVDGLMEFVGVNENRARTAIATLGHAPKASARLVPLAPNAQTNQKGKPNEKDAGALRIAASASVELPADHPTAEAYLVVAEDKLISRVGGGSNKGETWPHSSVARSFERVAEIPQGQQHFAGSLDVSLGKQPGNWQNLRVILIIQEKEDRHVLAVETVRLADLVPELHGQKTPGADAATPAESKVAAASSNKSGASGTAPER